MTLIKRRDEALLPGWWHDFLSNDWFDGPNIAQAGTRIPAVNLRDTNDSYEIELAAPGMKKSDFHVDLDNNVLTISSEQKSENSEKDKDGSYTRREFSYRSFKRSFTLPESAAVDKISAKYSDGVLYVSVPKKEEAKPKPARTIKIS